MYESSYLSLRPAPKIVLKTAWQVRHEDHQHADERNSDVEHGATKSRIDIWQDRRKEHQQADEEKFIVECGAARAEGETDTHLLEIRREEHQDGCEDKHHVEHGQTHTSRDEDKHSKVDY